MSTSTILYKNNLRTEATHTASGQVIFTDAPIDNNGKGEAFSPTDLVATALASCMITIIAIAAEKNNIDVSKTSANVKKIMGANPRTISDIVIEIKMRLDVSAYCFYFAISNDDGPAFNKITRGSMDHCIS